MLNVFLSNRIERLFCELKNNLFVSTHPFSNRIVIIPSTAIKGWLLRQMAQDPNHGIAAGMQIEFIESAIGRLCRLLNIEDDSNQTVICEPSQLEIALAIENEIINICKNFHTLPPETKALWSALTEYLHIPEKDLQISKRSQKRATALASTLAGLFIEYGKYGGRIVAEWPESSKPDWQQLLWITLEKLFHSWNYPYRKLESLIPNPALHPTDCQLHIFGLSYFSRLHHRFFLKISHFIPVNYYLLSPCLKFWSDLLSQKECAQLTKSLQAKAVPLLQQEALENFLYDSNPLLANFGRLGREMALQIESCELPLNESYCFSSAILKHPSYLELATNEIAWEENGPLKILEAVQADILLMRNPRKSERIAFDNDDGTIQVHASSKPMREVQTIYNVIMGLIYKHQDDEDPITPGDILVMAPDIGNYLLYIRAIFGSLESSLDYQLIDLQTPSYNPFIKGFLHLIKLPFSRWDAASLLQLFDTSAFQSKHRLDIEDVHLIRSWIKEAGICWGKDFHHRNELLLRDHCSKKLTENSWRGTWDYGFGRLLDTLVAMGDERQHLLHETAFAPLETFEMTQSQLLGDVIKLFHSLLEDLKPLGDDTQFTLAAWGDYLKCLCNAYFQPETEEEKEGYQVLMEQINGFCKADILLKNASFGFYTIQKHLIDSLQTSSMRLKEANLQSIRFCSLLPMRTVPAKAVVLMGMQEQAYSEEEISLNLLSHHPQADYYPSRSDFSRYLFLEALLSARHYFIISYISQAENEINEQPPSPLVQELLSYLDSGFKILGEKQERLSLKCHHRHPPHAFDAKYFTSGNSLKNHFMSDYHAAVAHADQKARSAHNFLQGFSPLKNHRARKEITSQAEVISLRAYTPQGQIDSLSTEEIIIDLADLLAFSRHPLKIFLNSLGIHLEKQEDKMAGREESLSLSSLNAWILAKQGLYSSASKLFSWAENTGKLPQGPFKILGKEQVLSQIEAYKMHLNSSETPSRLHFNHKYESPEFAENLWTFPPLKIKLADIGHVHLIGKIDTVCENGLILFEKEGIDGTIRHWPSILVYFLLIEIHRLEMPKNIIFAKSRNKPKDGSSIDAQKALERYLKYYLEARPSPSPFMPEWVSFILNGDIEELKQKFLGEDKNLQSTSYDEYVKWLRRCSPDLEFESSLKYWQEKAHELFADLFQTFMCENSDE